MALVAQLTLCEGQQRFTIELSTGAALASVVPHLTNKVSSIDCFDLLSQHPDFAVRMAVAGKVNLSNEAVGRLATDSSQSVVQQLLQSKAARKRLSSSQVLTIAHRDPELAGTVAAVLEDFSLDDDTVAAYLESHPDTHVRAILAANPFIGNAVLRRLATSDADEHIREIATDMLA